MDSRPALHLFPNLLSPEADARSAFVPAVAEAVLRIQGLFSEDPKHARRFLSHFDLGYDDDGVERSVRDIPILRVDKKGDPMDVEDALGEASRRGEEWGFVTDAGLPCLADPGSRLVSSARRLGIDVIVYPGPSSLVMAIQLSGLFAQSFAFKGYLERGPKEKRKQLESMERRMYREREVQLFIETPYNNKVTFEIAVEVLAPETILCVACDLTSEDEFVKTQSVEQWRKSGCPEIYKRPAIFIFGP